MYFVVLDFKYQDYAQAHDTTKVYILIIDSIFLPLRVIKIGY